jgi:hypothetical protein
MKRVWKLVCLLGVIALIAVTAFAYTVLFPAFPAEASHLTLLACVTLAAGYAVGSFDAVFTKRHTAATGFG